MKTRLMSLAIAALGVSLATPALASPAINLTTPGLTYPGTPYTLGFEFTVSAPETIDALGVYADSGVLSADAQVGLWDASGNLLASTSIASGSTVTNFFSYGSITPFALTPGTNYIVGAYTTALASSLGTSQGGAGSVNPLITIIQDQFAFSSSLIFPGTSDSNAGGAWLGANFDIGNGSTGVPEPASWAMMLAGMGAIGFAMRRRATVSISHA